MRASAHKSKIVSVADGAGCNCKTSVCSTAKALTHTTEASVHEKRKGERRRSCSIRRCHHASVGSTAHAASARPRADIAATSVRVGSRAHGTTAGSPTCIAPFSVGTRILSSMSASTLSTRSWWTASPRTSASHRPSTSSQLQHRPSRCER
eukprot:2484226-Pleurochrysis_carterae.AAC.3